MCRQKPNLLWLMIVCCSTCQITCSEKLIIQVNLTDQCFWNQSSSPYPDIKWTCLTAHEPTGIVKLNISSFGQCRSYSFNIKEGGNYEIRMNETIQGIKLWLFTHDNCLLSVLKPAENMTCQAQVGIMSNGSINPKTGCQNINPVDPEVECRNAVNNSDICSGKEQSRYLLNLKKNNQKCETCTDGNSTTVTSLSHNTTLNPTNSSTSHTTTLKPTNSSTSHTTTLKPTNSSTSHTTTLKPTTSSTSHTTTPKPTITLTPHKATHSSTIVEDGYTDPSKASEALDNLESKMEEMEKSNKSNEAIVTKDSVGLIYVQANNTETKDINICYSSNHAMVVESQSGMKTDYSWSVNISKEAFDKSRLENNGTAFVGVLRFKNLRNKDETKNQTVLNNEVYGITMRANIANLSNNIEMFFTNNDKDSKASCRSWDGKGELNWTKSGCETEINNNTIKCSCSHLTFFAVLMIPQSQSNANETALHLESLTYITYIGCGISMFFLSIALFMHFLLRKAKSNQATKILMNMFVALCLLNVSFLSNESVANTEDNGACVFIALVLHYSMLASFTWFFIQALHMYLWLIRQNVTITNYMRKITVLGWACPAPIVVVIASVEGYKAVILNATSGKIARMCWITSFYIYYIVNIGYYALVFIFTTGIFIMIVTKVFQARNIRATDSKRKTFRKQLMMVLSLFLLFGLTWSVAFFSYGPMLIPSYYIFTVLNSFQGFFLFLYYYHIHNDVAGNFSDDPESTDSNTTIAQSSINAVENI